ncbi:MAG TPA: flagellar export protein FliJ [Sedimenticola sp.]|nr:flagellar export protein FliJ [Sedimenticola sp.]
MAPSKRFKPVLRVAESRERTAARQLGDSQRNMREQEARLEELRRYHQEYLERFDVAARSGMSAAQLREYQAFIAKLELAIREQEAIVQASDTDCCAKQAEWQQKRVRSQVLDKVVQRCESEERRTRESREQKETDERNQRR